MESLVYAYLGDAVYELHIRNFLINKGIAKVKDIARESLNYVSATSQRRILEELINRQILSEE